jgi:formylglycine-generating enzyme required for sulfatase activity
VYINGEYKGSTRLDLDLTPGQYRVRVSKQDHEDWERQITLEEGAEEVLWAKLVRSTKSSTMSQSDVDRPSAAKPKQKKAWRDPMTGMAFAWVPEGCFQMGSNEGDSDEKPVHEVCVDGFWMGKYELTQGQWKQIMGNNPSYFKKGDNHPVETVSWNDVQGFIKKLNSEGQGGFRLPTEAEWEYACRSGGKKEMYCGGNVLDRVAWYSKNSGSKTHLVGKKAANGLGLYDMSGNVWEWVSDWYNGDYYGKSPRNNPKGPREGSSRVIRGGGWGGGAGGCRSACRGDWPPGYRYYHLGFRLARTHP